MNTRNLAVAVTVDCTKTRCGECRFQHPEVSKCILFNEALSMWEHKRLAMCTLAEREAKRGGIQSDDPIMGWCK